MVYTPRHLSTTMASHAERGPSAMASLLTIIKALFRDEEGAQLVEYTLILLLASIVCVGGLMLISAPLQNTFSAMSRGF